MGTAVAPPVAARFFEPRWAALPLTTMRPQRAHQSNVELVFLAGWGPADSQRNPCDRSLRQHALAGCGSAHGRTPLRDLTPDPNGLSRDKCRKRNCQMNGQLATAMPNLTTPAVPSAKGGHSWLAKLARQTTYDFYWSNAPLSSELLSDSPRDSTIRPVGNWQRCFSW